MAVRGYVRGCQCGANTERDQLNTSMRITEITANQPLTPDKARIDTLTKQKDRASDALKAERDRQKRAKAVTQMRDAQRDMLLVGKI